MDLLCVSLMLLEWEKARSGKVKCAAYFTNELDLAKSYGGVAGGGLATFPMRFNAIVFRPFKGEVFDAVVTQVNKLGFFAQVGPLQIFVSKHLIPTDMKFDPQSHPAAYVSEISDEQPQRVTKDSEVRLRVVATRIDASEIFAIGTIKDEYLGVM